MTNNVKTSLEKINKLSRLLMSQLDVRIENTERDNSQKTINIASSENSDDDQYTDQQLAKLVTERHALINQLFETYTQDQLSIELPLINELVSLDNQLTSKSQHNKKALAANILKLKKSKKVSKLYQRY